MNIIFNTEWTLNIIAITIKTTKDIGRYLSKNRPAVQVRSHDEIQITFHSNSKYENIYIYLYPFCYTQAPIFIHKVRNVHAISKNRWI